MKNRKLYFFSICCLVLGLAFSAAACSDDDDDEDKEKEFVIPTAPDDILEYIQGKWVGRETDNPKYLNCLTITNDTLCAYAVNAELNQTMGEDVIPLKIENGKLFYALEYKDGTRKTFLTVPEEGVLMFANEELGELRCKRENFTLPPYSMDFWVQVLGGRWECNKAVDRYTKFILVFSGTGCTISAEEPGEEQPVLLEGTNMLIKEGELILEGMNHKYKVKRNSLTSITITDMAKGTSSEFKYVEPPKRG